VDDEFDVEIDADGNASATHRVHGHIYEFVVIPTEPYVTGGSVQENQRADHDHPEFFEAARNAVLRHVRARGLIAPSR
jgi:hypothetical protein